MKNSKYTKEFKDSTTQLVKNSDKSAMQISKDLDINDKTLYRLNLLSWDFQNWSSCNRQRLHSYNNYMSPVEFEEKMLRLEMVE